MKVALMRKHRRVETTYSVSQVGGRGAFTRRLSRVEPVPSHYQRPRGRNERSTSLARPRAATTPGTSAAGCERAADGRTAGQSANRLAATGACAIGNGSRESAERHDATRARSRSPLLLPDRPVSQDCRRRDRQRRSAPASKCVRHRTNNHAGRGTNQLAKL